MCDRMVSVKRTRLTFFGTFEVFDDLVILYVIHNILRYTLAGKFNSTIDSLGEI